MALFNSLTFDGVNSLDSGIYITGEAVYNAPQRQVEMVTIPGRNGTLAIDQGRFENIEVTYPAGCFADDQTDFAEKVRAFRNELASRFGYKRLVDTYHPDEFRLGTYSAGLEVGAVGFHNAGEFDITFECKPQRFLVSGEEAVTIGEWGETETASGDIVEIDNPDGTLGVKSLLVTLDPIQDLNGYDKPWSGGDGKNKIDMSWLTDRTVNGVTFTNTDDGITLSGTASSTTNLNGAVFTLPSGTYTISGSITNNQIYVYDTVASTVLGESVNGVSRSFTTTEEKTVYIRVRVGGGSSVNGKIQPQLEVGSTATSYAPYSNICPISGRTEVVTHVSPTTSAEDGDTYTTSLGQTVYGGTLDVVSGVLTVDKACRTYTTFESFSASPKLIRLALDSKPVGNSEVGNIIANYLPTTYVNNIWANTGISGVAGNPGGYIYARIAGLSTAEEYSDYLASNPLQVCYELATPQTYTLTPQQIDLLLGQNNVWSDGAITIEYGLLPNIIVNPTLFASNPLLVVTGAGTLSIGNQTLAIASGSADQVIYIDCDSQEAWEIVGGGKLSRNDYIQNAGEAFPVLNPGANAITLGTGITQLDITPRWWRV